MKASEFRVLWRGEAWVVHAIVSEDRVRIFSMHEDNARDAKTFIDTNPTGEASEAEALSALTTSDRLELFALVRESWARSQLGGH